MTMAIGVGMVMGGTIITTTMSNAVPRLIASS